MCSVTIGLPVYNNAPFLADAIQSVLNQTFTDWELLIVDDGSTDESLAVARSFADPRIQIRADHTNRGLPARLNEITRLARGRYHARMDADDIMLPDRLQTQVDLLDTCPEVDLVSTYAYAIDVYNQVYGIRGTTQLPTTLREAAGGVPLIHPTVMARQAWFQQHPYRESCRRAQDFDLWLRTLERSSFRVIDRPLLFYRELGIPYLYKYLRSSAGIRAILWRLPRRSIGLVRLAQLLIYSYGKDVIYHLVNLLGREDRLLLRRNRFLTPTEQQQAQVLVSRATKPNR